MRNLVFVDRRGDEYKFVKYSTGEVNIRKQRAGHREFSQIYLSEETVKKLREFLGG